MITVHPRDVDSAIRDWLSVRHAIAHGHQHLPTVDVLQAVRSARSPLTDPPIRLVDAEQCLDLFKRVVRATGDALAIHLGVSSVKWE